jgi:hypothetical protein
MKLLINTQELITKLTNIQRTKGHSSLQQHQGRTVQNKLFNMA